MSNVSDAMLTIETLRFEKNRLEAEVDRLKLELVAARTTVVGIVKAQDGRITCVHGDLEKARAKVAEYNADPFLRNGDPDFDAPYTVQPWSLIDRLPRG